MFSFVSFIFFCYASAVGFFLFVSWFQWQWDDLKWVQFNAIPNIQSFYSSLTSSGSNIEKEKPPNNNTQKKNRTQNHLHPPPYLPPLNFKHKLSERTGNCFYSWKNITANKHTHTHTPEEETKKKTTNSENSVEISINFCGFVVESCKCISSRKRTSL